MLTDLCRKVVFILFVVDCCENNTVQNTGPPDNPGINRRALQTIFVKAAANPDVVECVFLKYFFVNPIPSFSILPLTIILVAMTGSSWK